MAATAGMARRPDLVVSRRGGAAPPTLAETPATDHPIALPTIGARQGSPRRSQARATSTADPADVGRRHPLGPRQILERRVLTPRLSVLRYRNARASVLTLDLAWRNLGIACPVSLAQLSRQRHRLSSAGSPAGRAKLHPAPAPVIPRAQATARPFSVVLLTPWERAQS